MLTLYILLSFMQHLWILGMHVCMYVQCVSSVFAFMIRI